MYENQNYTYADMQQWEESVLTELIDGKRIDKKTPHVLHQQIFGNLMFLLANRLHKNKDYQVLHFVGVAPFAEPDNQPQEIDTVIIPDIAILKRPHPIINDCCFAGPPELVIEILEEQTREYEEQTKLKLYEQAEVPELWFVYTERKEVQVYRRSGEKYVNPEILSGTDAIASKIVPGGILSLQLIFREF